MSISKYELDHRPELKDVKFIRFIKDVLLEQLDYIQVFYFLNVIYGSIEYSGSYREIEKGLLILYHIVSGLSGRKCISLFHMLHIMNYIKDLSFKSVYHLSISQTR